MINFNINNKATSLLVSKLWLLPKGNYIQPKGHNPVLIKNITDNNITVEVLLVDSNEYISTVLYPGWNPELIVGIKNVPNNSLQAGN